MDNLEAVLQDQLLFGVISVSACRICLCFPGLFCPLWSYENLFSLHHLCFLVHKSAKTGGGYFGAKASCGHLGPRSNMGSQVSVFFTISYCVLRMLSSILSWCWRICSWSTADYCSSESAPCLPPLGPS